MLPLPGSTPVIGKPAAALQTSRRVVGLLAHPSRSFWAMTSQGSSRPWDQVSPLFQPGDAVYGQTRLGEALAGGTGAYIGAYAEYTTTFATNLAPKPATIDHLHAAAVPTAALTAWQALFEYGKLEAGQSVLINGAAGGVGHLAVQLAKARGGAGHRSGLGTP
nr:hypothetical protein [Ktedonobacter robiniae]